MTNGLTMDYWMHNGLMGKQQTNGLIMEEQRANRYTMDYRKWIENRLMD